MKTSREILNIALRQSAYDCCCAPEDFGTGKNVVRESFETDKAKKFIQTPAVFLMTSYGANVVACARKDVLAGITDVVGNAETASDCFQMPAVSAFNAVLAAANAKIRYMGTYFLPDPDRLYDIKTDCPYDIKVLTQEKLADLYLPQWKNALCAQRKQLDVLGVGAYDGDELVGLAGCSADGGEMWQIGIDVLPAYRRKGIASCLTVRLAKETFARGKTPFYSAAWANVASVRNAARSGFLPAWAEMEAESQNG